MSPNSLELLSSLKIINDPDKLKEHITQMKEAKTRVEKENLQLKTQLQIIKVKCESASIITVERFIEAREDHQ
jgi:hypothetical protein